MEEKPTPDAPNATAAQSGRWLRLVMLALVGVWLTYLVVGLGLKALGVVTLDEWGQFGDAFGFINSIAACIAVAGAILTLDLQRQQLADQQNQLTEQKEQIDATRRQQAILAFDASFFNLLSMMRELRDRIRLVELDDKTSERRLRDETGVLALYQIMNRIGERLWDPDRPSEHAISEIARIPNDTAWWVNLDQIGPYTRLVYDIVLRIDNHPNLSKAERDSYIHILNGQLSPQELVIVAITAAQSGQEPYRDLITKYAFLRALYAPSDGIYQHLKEVYRPAAFGRLEPKS